MIANKSTIERAVAATYQARTPGWKGRIDVLEDLLANPSREMYWRDVMIARHKPHTTKEI